MKIAIYGDSFAAEYNGWPKYIGEHYSTIPDIYALGGSSIDFTYLNFIKTEKEYDKVIVLWSSQERTSLILQDYSTNDYLHLGECHKGWSPNTVYDYNNSRSINMKYYLNMEKYDWCEKNKDWIFFRNNKEDEKPIRKLLQYWISQEFSNYKKTYQFGNIHGLKQEAMRDSVRHRRPDAVVIECFKGNGMFNIQNADFSNLFGEVDEWWQYYKENHEIRKNHLSPIQNKEFAKYVIKHIEDPTFDIHTTFDRTTIDKYYTMSNNIEESGFIETRNAKL